jgi:hypothetical protein
MKKMGLVLCVILLIVTCTGCMGITPARKISGRVLVSGVAPNRAITVIYYVNSADGVNITTNFSGYYTIPSTAYNVGDQVRIEINGSTNYDSVSNAKANGINSWTGIKQFTTGSGVISVPDLDLYNYGMEITDPEADDYVTFPYSVQFNEYNRIVSNKEYYLYFGDLSNNYIGCSKYYFYSSPYSFDGILADNSSVDCDAYWYIDFGYQDNGYNVYIATFGTLVYYGISGSSLKKHVQMFQADLTPVGK